MAISIVSKDSLIGKSVKPAVLEFVVSGETHKDEGVYHKEEPSGDIKLAVKDSFPPDVPVKLTLTEHGGRDSEYVGSFNREGHFVAGVSG
jgi:hypothetical protein